MEELTKRVVEGLKAQIGRDLFIWDTEMRGFGV
jgi:hypothetical protein